MDYVNSLLDLIDKIDQSNGQYSYDAINSIIDEDLRKIKLQPEDEVQKS